MLEDVFPGASRSVHLAHGILRAPARVPVEMSIRLTYVSREFLPGHSLRVAVSSSLWPLYAANAGGEDYLNEIIGRISTHAIHHGGTRPSRIELPVVR
jgi:predicted acyl esterase